MIAKLCILALFCYFCDRQQFYQYERPLTIDKSVHQLSTDQNRFSMVSNLLFVAIGFFTEGYWITLI